MWKQSLAVLPGIAVSLLPKLMCPMCGPAYAGLVSALGLGFLISTKYLLPLTVAFLAIAATVLGFRASRRHGYGPLWLGLCRGGGDFERQVLFRRTARDLRRSRAVDRCISLEQLAASDGYNPLLPWLCSGGGGASTKGTDKENRYMKHKFEVFSAGCKTCKDTIEAVRKLAGSEHEVVVHDMHQQEIASRATQHSVRSLPAVVIDGKLAGCRSGRGVEEHVLREALR